MEPLHGRFRAVQLQSAALPRPREELGWAPRGDRLDILEECRNPVYAKDGTRALPSWVHSPVPS
ncbi:hypothetical protein [Sphingobium aromaticiconvertens]|uniref:hypothetical protein n=1 Tax=Sphingobium aromaticiconvertens TaxID=365341 RepID=UPI0030187842